MAKDFGCWLARIEHNFMWTPCFYLAYTADVGTRRCFQRASLYLTAGLLRRGNAKLSRILFFFKPLRSLSSNDLD